MVHIGMPVPSMHTPQLILVIVLPRRSRQVHSRWREARGRHAAKKPAGFWRRNVSLGAAAPAGLVAKVIAWAT